MRCNLSLCLRFTWHQEATKRRQRGRPLLETSTKVCFFFFKWWNESVAFSWVMLLPRRVCVCVCVCVCACMCLFVCVCVFSTIPKKHSNTLVSGNLVFHSMISLSCHIFQITLPTVRKPPSQWLRHIFITGSTFAGPTSHPPHAHTHTRTHTHTHTHTNTTFL